MADWPTPASVLGDPGALENHKRRVFEVMEVRDRLGQRSKYTPHDHQAKVHFPGRQTKVDVVVAGRRGGKSKLCEAEALAMMGIEGTMTWVGAPTYTLTDRVFQPVFKALVVDQIFGVAPVRKRNTAGSRMIEMPWGAVIEGKSAERPASSKGASLDLFIDDECAEHDESYYTEYVGPGLADRQGRAIFPSTPLGYTWFHDYFKRGQTKKFQDLGWASHHWRSEDNPHLDQEWLRQQKMVVPAQVWRQEYLAEFLARAGLIWEEFREEYFDALDAPGHLYNPAIHKVDPAWTWYRGIDIGANHPTGCVWVSIDPKGNAWVDDEYLLKGALHQEHARNISARTTFAVMNSVISWEANKGDGQGGRTALQAYQENGVYATPAPKDRDLRINAVAEYLRATLEDSPTKPKLFISNRCPKLIHQMKKYRWAEAKPGQPAQTKPHRVGVDDDLCDALGHILVTRPSYAPRWMSGDVPDMKDEVVRYGHEDSFFARSHQAARGRIGIPGLGTLPRIVN